MEQEKTNEIELENVSVKTGFYCDCWGDYYALADGFLWCSKCTRLYHVKPYSEDIMKHFVSNMIADIMKDLIKAPDVSFETVTLTKTEA